MMSGSGNSSLSLLDDLHALIGERRDSVSDTSYTASLLNDSVDRVVQKFGEESVELVIEAIKGDRVGMVNESADVLYHLLVLWQRCGVDLGDVVEEMRRRQTQSGLQEKANRGE